MLKFRQTKDTTTSYQLRNIPANIWKKFKIRCMEDNLPTLQDGIIGLIKQYNSGKIKID